MKNTNEVLSNAIAKAIAGELAPNFMTADFQELMQAVKTNPNTQEAFASIGRAAVMALLERLEASMQADRALSIMRVDNNLPM